VEKADMVSFVSGIIGNESINTRWDKG